jgi:hypothetical protein
MLSNMEEAKREKTAYEVQQMVAEKLTLFSPMFGRITREKLNPTIARTVEAMIRASEVDWMQGRDGVLPLPPDEALNGAGYNIVYVSKIALAIKAAENQAFATMMALVTQLAEVDRSLVHVIKLREGVRRIGRNVGIPASLVRSDREVDAITAAEQKQQQAMMAAQTAELATRSAKNLGPRAQEMATEAVG